MTEAGQAQASAGLCGESSGYLRKLVLWNLLAWLALSAVPVGSMVLLFGEHFRRAAIVESGVRLEAKIPARYVRDARWGRVCHTVYEFIWAGRRHISSFEDCPDSLPVGAALHVAFDPAAPSRSFALVQGTWAGRARVFPFVLLAAFAACWYLLVPSMRAIAELARRRLRRGNTGT